MVLNSRNLNDKVLHKKKKKREEKGKKEICHLLRSHSRVRKMVVHQGFYHLNSSSTPSRRRWSATVLSESPHSTLKKKKNKHILNLFNHQLLRSSTTIIILFKMFNDPVFVKSWLLNTNQLTIIPKKKQEKTNN